MMRAFMRRILGSTIGVCPRTGRPCAFLFRRECYRTGEGTSIDKTQCEQQEVKQLKRFTRQRKAKRSAREVFWRAASKDQDRRVQARPQLRPAPSSGRHEG